MVVWIILNHTTNRNWMKLNTIREGRCADGFPGSIHNRCRERRRCRF